VDDRKSLISEMRFSGDLRFMTPTISSLADRSSILYEGRAKKSVLDDISAMEKDAWKNRLLAEIEKKGKSQRAVSLAAGMGPGYINSWLNENKDPTVENLIKVCEVLDVTLSFILYGYDITPASQEILALLEKRPDSRDAILKLLKDKA